MDKKAYLYIVEAGQFSFEVEIKELLGKVGIIGSVNETPVNQIHYHILPHFTFL